MELSFTKDAHGMWVSEFEVNSDFNLHIERTKGGIISLYQRTTGGGWDHVDAFEYVRHQASIDFDCAALVYPKWCKIESEVEPSYAAITTDGEVTEIKSQSKEVEITANGVTEIAPDAGFGYLSGVKVNVNVPQSGEGGSSIEYLDVSELLANLENNLNAVIILSAATQVKCAYNGILMAGPLYSIVTLFKGDFSAMAKSTTQICVDWSMKLSAMGELQSILNQVLSKITQEELDALPRITEAEFYNTTA